MTVLESLAPSDLEAHPQMGSSRFPACGDARNEDGACADSVRSDRKNTDKAGENVSQSWEACTRCFGVLVTCDIARKGCKRSIDFG